MRADTMAVPTDSLVAHLDNLDAHFGKWRIMVGNKWSILCTFPNQCGVDKWKHTVTPCLRLREIGCNTWPRWDRAWPDSMIFLGPSGSEGAWGLILWHCSGGDFRQRAILTKFLGRAPAFDRIIYKHVGELPPLSLSNNWDVCRALSYYGQRGFFLDKAALVITTVAVMKIR